MRRIKMALAAAAALALAVLALAPSGSLANSQPHRDTAVATGDNFVVDDFSSFNVDINAFSGPTGENPGGQVSLDVGVVRLPISAPVTCLNVTGNTAVISVAGPFPSWPGVLGLVVRLVDNGGAGLDRFDYYPVLPEIDFPVDCRTGAPGYFGGLLDGRAVVHDAQPLPCETGGFASCSDTDPPETTITKSPPASTDKHKVRFRFTSDESSSTFECMLDDLGFSSCASPTRLKHLRKGKHKFSVRAIDSAGNLDPSAAKQRFEVVD